MWLGVYASHSTSSSPRAHKRPEDLRDAHTDTTRMREIISCCVIVLIHLFDHIKSYKTATSATQTMQAVIPINVYNRIFQLITQQNTATANIPLTLTSKSLSLYTHLPCPTTFSGKPPFTPSFGHSAVCRSLV